MTQSAPRHIEDSPFFLQVTIVCFQKVNYCRPPLSDIFEFAITILLLGPFIESKESSSGHLFSLGQIVIRVVYNEGAEEWKIDTVKAKLTDDHVLITPMAETVL